MRHRKAGKRLGRDSSHREAMLRNMVTSLLKHEQIETTDARAKELRSVADRIITLAKRGDLHARRQALAYVRDKTITHRLFGELKDRYTDRQGGYTRIIKKGNRKGDSAPISVIQLIAADTDRKKGKKKDKAVITPSVEKPKKEKGTDIRESDKRIPENKNEDKRKDEESLLKEAEK